MQERHAVAASFRDKTEAERAVLALASEGVRDHDIRVLLPPGAHAREFKRDTGVESRTVGGEGILDRLAELFQGGATQLSDFGLSDQDQRRLEDNAKRGAFVVAVRCDGMCPNIHVVLARYGVTEFVGFQPESGRGQQTRMEYPYETGQREQRWTEQPRPSGESEQRWANYTFRTGDEGGQSRSDYPYRTGESGQPQAEYPYRSRGGEQRQDYPFRTGESSSDSFEERQR